MHSLHVSDMDASQPDSLYTALVGHSSPMPLVVLREPSPWIWRDWPWIQDVTTWLLSEVCLNVEVEPPLWPLSIETFPTRMANVGRTKWGLMSRLKLGFWGTIGNVYTLMWGYPTHRHQPCNCTQTIAASCNTMRKRRELHTREEMLKLSMDHLHILSYLPQQPAWGPSTMIFYKKITLVISMKQQHHIHNIQDDQMQNCLLLDWLDSDVLEGSWCSFTSQLGH